MLSRLSMVSILIVKLDCIANIFLKNCKQSLSVALALIFNRSLDQGVFFPEWRESFLTPIHKKGPKHQVENYRGITKLSAIPKMFERILKNKIYVLISQRNQVNTCEKLRS